MSKMEFKGKTETEALEKIANAPLEHHWGCDQILIDGCHFAMSDVQDYAKATLKNKPQLTIPKSIADELLKFRKSLSDPDTELLGWLTITTALYRYEHFSENFIDWWDELEGKANNLAIAYLNPLTRDLVKVVEG